MHKPHNIFTAYVKKFNVSDDCALFQLEKLGVDISDVTILDTPAALAQREAALQQKRDGRKDRKEQIMLDGIARLEELDVTVHVDRFRGSIALDEVKTMRRERTVEEKQEDSYSAKKLALCATI